MAVPGLQQTVAPQVEPITRNQAKAWLRVDVPDDDDLIDDLIHDAREFVENHTACQLITATYLYTLDSFPPLDQSYNLVRQPRAWLPQTRQFQGAGGGIIRLPRPPAQAVLSVKYADPATGVLTTQDPTLYLLDTTTQPARLAPTYGNVWPVSRFQPAAIQVTFTAGFGDTGDSVPGICKRAIRFLLTNWYENRGDMQARTQDVAMSAQALLDQGWYGEII